MNTFKDFETQLCGLCGNVDDDATNDFTTSDGVVSQDIGSFVNSWNTESSSCKDKAITERDTCAGKVQAKAFAQRQCNVINGNLFKDCHLVVSELSIRLCNRKCC